MSLLLSVNDNPFFLTTGVVGISDFPFYPPLLSIRKSVSSTFSKHPEAGHPQHLHYYCSGLILGSSLGLSQDHLTLMILPLVLCDLSAAKQPVILLKYRQDYVFPASAAFRGFPSYFERKPSLLQWQSKARFSMIFQSFPICSPFSYYSPLCLFDPNLLASLLPLGQASMSSHGELCPW